MPGLDFAPTPFFYIAAGAIAGLLLGWLIGFMDSNRRADKKIQAAEARSETAVREAAERSAKAQSEAAAAASQVQVLDDPGLLRLKNNGGKFTLEMDGLPVSESLGPEKRKRLVELVTVIRPYLENRAPEPQPAAPVIPPAPVPAPAPAAAKAPVKPEAPVGPLSMIMQIDSLLQKRLALGPLAKSGIRLADAPKGGVEVYVGLKKYEAIDDVPDEAVKAEIRAAIAEWEHKYTPR